MTRADNHENESTPEHEAGERNEPIEQYKLHLRLMADTYRQAADDISESYDEDIGQWPSDEAVSLADAEREFVLIMQEPRVRIGREMKFVHRETKEFFRKSNVDFVRSLKPTDLKVWKESLVAWNQRKKPDTRADMIGRVIKKASSPDVSDVMLAALDDRAWSDVEQMLPHNGNLHSGYKAVEPVINNASCSEAEQEMRCALDEGLWKEIQQQYHRFADPDARFEAVTQLLELASSDEVRGAMRAALDEEVWKSAKDAYNRWSNPAQRAELVEKVLRMASSENVRQGMGYLLGMVQRPVRQAPPATLPGGPPPQVGPATGHQPRPEPQPSPQPGPQPETGSPPPGAGPEGPLEPELSDEELDQLVRQVTDGDSRSILDGFIERDRDFIRGVIKQVNIARENIRNSGVEPTDLKVWSKFRVAQELATGRGASEEEQELIKDAFYVVNAFMNNNRRGTLPF
jgi:hypothetical protein